MTFATWLVSILAIYAVVGFVFAIVFVWRGVGRIDPAAAEGTWGFRLLIIPGAAALWPILARRWLRGEGPPEERNPHRNAARKGGR
ncbi:MAG: hypothetical protein GY719_07325 [bacterium]|nr:hypothetical protein [bacterium]